MDSGHLTLSSVVLNLMYASHAGVTQGMSAIDEQERWGFYPWPGVNEDAPVFI